MRRMCSGVEPQQAPTMRGARVEEGRILERHGLRAELVRDLVARHHRQPRVRVGDQRRLGHRPHLPHDDGGPVRSPAAVHPDDVRAGGEQVLRDLGGTLAPHRPVAVVELLVLEEHRGHDRQPGRLAGAHRRDRLLREHHRLDREEVDAALGERLGLLAERLEVLLVRRVPQRLVLGRAGGWSGRPTPPRSRGRARPRGPAARPAR